MFFPTVDSVISSFTKTVAKLERLRDEHKYKAAAKQEQSMRLSNEAQEHSNEAIRAQSIADKIKELVR